MRTPPSLPRQQRGALLILLVIALGVLAITLFVGMLSSSAIQNERDKKTAAALAEAKTALIGWSASRSSNTSNYTPGQLPCPEDLSLIGSPNEGTAASSCTLPAIGRLPWKTLKVGDIRDGYDEKLWYVISNGFRVPPINSGVSQAQLTVDGVPNSAVAIIFSPGPPLSGQVRPIPTATSPPLISNYLEGSNNDGDNQFVTQGPAGTFNDKLLAVTHHDLFSVVERRIANTIIGTTSTPIMGLRYYYANNLPSPAYPSSPLDYDQLNFDTYTKNMLINNRWDTVVSYTTPNSNLAQLVLPLYCTASTASGQTGIITCL
ncbi:hypothetical protein SFMTTN_1244 [Sulfuriferula multivorans]|uniref:Uncharacterized protein n=1 Tax=Sulfuriferula multivorans TaxID=1559896 RepID=A0A401JCX6_9PROT|nr:hypothetical protein [Sulfuriferula multivorans]GBL45437.1 hypothetical protein SFMTTN_1244 [Sulfuriferula multivorans]